MFTSTKDTDEAKIWEQRMGIFLKHLGDVGDGNKQHVTLLKSYAEFLQGPSYIQLSFMICCFLGLTTAFLK